MAENVLYDTDGMHIRFKVSKTTGMKVTAVRRLPFATQKAMLHQVDAFGSTGSVGVCLV